MAKIKRNQKYDDIDVQDFLLFLTAVIKRPAMYGVNTVEELSLFVLGYIAGKRNIHCTNLMSDFRAFVNNECEIDEKRDRDWPRIIRFYSGGDRHSLELFSTLFDKFIAYKKIKLPNSSRDVA